jgi:hypothetical protein
MMDDTQERDDKVIDSGNCAANSCVTICAASERLCIYQPSVFCAVANSEDAPQVSVTEVLLAPTPWAYPNFLLSTLTVTRVSYDQTWPKLVSQGIHAPNTSHPKQKGMPTKTLVSRFFKNPE